MALGWSWEQVENDLDMPRYAALLDLWTQYPPGFILASQVLASFSKKGSASQSDSRILTAGAPAWKKPTENRLPEQILSGELPIPVRRVPKNYHTLRLAQLLTGLEDPTTPNSRPRLH